MLRKRLFSRALAPLGLSAGLAASLAGCPDPETRYDDFIANSAEERGQGAPDFMPPDMGDMSTEPFDPASMAGSYMLSLATELDPGRPLVFRADITVAGEPGSRTIELNLTPLRSWCGGARCEPNDPTFREELEPAIPSPGPVSLSEEGVFEVDFGSINAPGGANNISGSDIAVNLKLYGQPASDGSPCGQIEGALTAPFAFDLKRESNNFGMAPGSGPYNMTPSTSSCI